jgi:hypothetical protein
VASRTRASTGIAQTATPTAIPSAVTGKDDFLGVII